MRDTPRMKILCGGTALSPFRADKLRRDINARFAEQDLRCDLVSAIYLHFVEVNREPTPQELTTLAQLLHYGDGAPNKTAPSQNRATRITAPRIGTISPWSTKATDILHQCGLTVVARVERGVEWSVDFNAAPPPDEKLTPLLHDRMTESVLPTRDAAQQLFSQRAPSPPAVVDILGGGLAALEKADDEFGFALSAPEKKYLVAQFQKLNRNPTDVELMMFAQVNSEHCRHKIFNADWRIDGAPAAHSLFEMIRQTHAAHGAGTLVAYDDNAAVLAGRATKRLHAHPQTRAFGYQFEPVHLVAKVETHNHPTAISPFAGAATGAGGEIRDGGATGRGGKPKAGVVGYAVSHLRLPDCARAWESAIGEKKPSHIASPLQIMLDAPVGAAAFNNEFGRPCIAGYFRNFEHVEHVEHVDDSRDTGNINYGYHKPIMLAGGIGNIRPRHVRKDNIADRAPLVVLGGPAMRIGLGGGAASSIASGDGDASLAYQSVQRGNPEMQRRCQEVIDACCALGDANPIASIHDVGAGGLCNALPELVHDSARGGAFELRDILNDEAGMTPLQIWCNESQERYVLAIAPTRDAWSRFEKICAREKCPFAVVGHASALETLTVRDRHFSNTPINLPMEVLFGSIPKMLRDVASVNKNLTPLNLTDITIKRAAELVLSFPAVADKTYLVTIGDRSVGGLIARDQMVGPWQVPVADVGVAARGYCTHGGEAVAIGERAPLALINAAASARMAVGEAITNIAAAAIGSIANIKLSANWMAAAGEAGVDADLFSAVRAVALELCPQLGVSIPVGKDSMSMKTVWQDGALMRKILAPLSLVVTAFAAVEDIRKTATPQLQVNENEPHDLWLLDLGGGQNRLGGSVLAQVLMQLGDTVPDVDAVVLKNFFGFIQSLLRDNLLRAYHDRSDGGLFATLCEMAFAARCGLAVDIQTLTKNAAPMTVLFNEELGAVIQTPRAAREQVTVQLNKFALESNAHHIGEAVAGDAINITAAGETVLNENRAALHRIWSETTWRMQSLRDNPACAAQEYARIDDTDDPGLFSRVTFHIARAKNTPSLFNLFRRRPSVAILREQGVNGQLEMAAAFTAAGFEAVDVTMSDLSAGASLADYKGIAACGGFSFGDVLGAGEGWAKSILYNAALRDAFAEFFARTDTFALGVCNGCQMLAAINILIPGAAHWPRFARNTSEQYEARVAMVEICSEQSVLLRDMHGAMLPVSTAHGEGRAQFSNGASPPVMRFVDNHGTPTETYPANPNGSPAGATGFTNDDGRFTIMMPHPERVFRAACNSYRPRDGYDGEYSPWIKIFQNARAWVE